MRSFDAGLTVSVEEVLSGKDHLGSGSLVAKLENGRFAHSTQMLQIAVAYADHIARTEERIQELKQRVAAGSQI